MCGTHARTHETARGARNQVAAGGIRARDTEREREKERRKREEKEKEKEGDSKVIPRGTFRRGAREHVRRIIIPMVSAAAVVS